MREIDMGIHKLFYERTGAGAFHYRITNHGLTFAVGDVDGVRGNVTKIRSHLIRIAREALGWRGEPVFRATPEELLAGARHVGAPKAVAGARQRRAR